MQTVVITGAGGFLGGHAADAFSAVGWRVVGISRSDANAQASRFAAFHRDDVREVARLQTIFRDEIPDTVVHLAGPASVPDSLRDPRSDFLGQTLPLLNVLEALRLTHRETKMLVVSSAAVYGNPQTLPVSETAQPAPISPYGFHKLQQELLLEEYVQLHGLRGCIARLFSTYGESLRRLAVWEMTNRALRGDVEVFGTGTETRDYLYAGDVARALVTIVERAVFAGEVINVASGEEVSIRTLATETFRLAGIDAPPTFSGHAMSGSPSHWRADIARLRALGFEPPVWSRGLEQTIRWIRTATTL